MRGKGAWRLPTNLEATYAAKMAVMTSTSPPQTIHSIERVGLFMIGWRIAHGWIGPVYQVPLLGGFMDQVSTSANHLNAQSAIAVPRLYVADCSQIRSRSRFDSMALDGTRSFQRRSGSEPEANRVRRSVTRN